MRLVRFLIVLLAVLMPRCISAHWITHERLPDWAQRGAMRSCVAPVDGETLHAWIDTDPMACDFNVIFTGVPAWENALTPTQKLLDLYLRPRGAHLFFYTCPNSIYFDDTLEREQWSEDPTSASWARRGSPGPSSMWMM